jgi:hypothetical protein
MRVSKVKKVDVLCHPETLNQSIMSENTRSDVQ